MILTNIYSHASYPLTRHSRERFFFEENAALATKFERAPMNGDIANEDLVDDKKTNSIIYRVVLGRFAEWILLIRLQFDVFFLLFLNVSICIL